MLELGGDGGESIRVRVRASTNLRGNKADSRHFQNGGEAALTECDI